MALKPTESFKISKREYLEAIARETAKMSYPGSMSRGKKPIVKAKTKEALEDYFVSKKFPIEELWDGTGGAYTNYDEWHAKQTKKISDKVVAKKLADKNREPLAVSVKFLNTFMHQLIKYKKFQKLYPFLHLPLDDKVLKRLNSKLGKKKQCVFPELKELVQKYLKKKKGKKNGAYCIEESDYVTIQKWLMCLLKKYQVPQGIKLNSRIDLNAILWPGRTKGKKRKN
jgi:hypothetical protein